MAYSFVCELNGDPNVKIAHLRQQAGARGIVFVGDTSSGEFSGFGLSGRYAVHGTQVKVTIDSVPIFYTYQKAETQIRGFLRG